MTKMIIPNKNKFMLVDSLNLKLNFCNTNKTHTCTTNYLTYAKLTTVHLRLICSENVKIQTCLKVCGCSLCEHISCHINLLWRRITVLSTDRLDSILQICLRKQVLFCKRRFCCCFSIVCGFFFFVFFCSCFSHHF